MPWVAPYTSEIWNCGQKQKLLPEQNFHMHIFTRWSKAKWGCRCLPWGGHWPLPTLHIVQCDHCETIWMHWCRGWAWNSLFRDTLFRTGFYTGKQGKNVAIRDTTHKERPYFVGKRPTQNCDPSLMLTMRAPTTTSDGQYLLIHLFWDRMSAAVLQMKAQWSLSRCDVVRVKARARPAAGPAVRLDNINKVESAMNTIPVSTVTFDICCCFLFKHVLSAATRFWFWI